MVFNLCSKDGHIKLTIPLTDGCMYYNSIGGDSYVGLSALLDCCVSIEVGDYGDYQGHRFWAVAPYTPRQEGGQHWRYNVQLFGAQSIIGGALMLNALGTPLFALTAPAVEHIQLVVDNINRWLGRSQWHIGGVIATDPITIDYSSGVYCNEAMAKIAEQTHNEWWAEGTTLHLGKCLSGEPIRLSYQQGLRNIEAATASNVKFFSRLYPIGSSRNIDADRYGDTRLHLPNGQRYIERNTEHGIVEHYEAAAFADIYPKRIGTLSSVRSHAMRNSEGKPSTIYYVKDDVLPFDPNQYSIGGLVKHLIFQTGDLAGLDFECNYDSITGEFELITQYPYNDDTQLPNEVLTPKQGDTYVLYNLRMPDEYYPLAEQELAAAVAKYMDEHCIDHSLYKAATDYIYWADHQMTPQVGQRVRLYSDELFGQAGYRDTRITQVAVKMSRPTDADIEMSDVLSRTTQRKMQDEIKSLYHEVRAAQSTLPAIIRSWEATEPTDNHLYSARAVSRHYLSSDKADTAKGKITFEDGVVVGKGGEIDKAGNATLVAATLRQYLTTPHFVDGLLGEGYRLWLDEQGLSHLAIDKMTVRQTMTVLEMLIQKVRSVGGQLIVSAANGKIETVDWEGEYCHLSFETAAGFEVGDLIRCATFSTGEKKDYWVEVAAVTDRGVKIAISEFGNILPAVGDECVLMGSTTQPHRSNLISISATEDGQPRLDVIDGINSKSLAGGLRTRLGSLEGIYDSYFPQDAQPKGYGLYADNAYLRGNFILSTGEDVRTKFKVEEGKVQSALEGLRRDFVSDRGFLSNSSFTTDLSKWYAPTDSRYWTFGGRWVVADGRLLGTKGDGAGMTTDAGRRVLCIRNKYILQRNADMVQRPRLTTTAEGVYQPTAVYLTFFYRVVKAGRLRIEFDNINQDNTTPFESLHVEEDLVVTEEYRQYSCSGLWNGTGDFKLSFSGEIYLYMLVLSEDKADALAYRYQTLFEQSERLAKLSAAVYDKDAQLLQEAGLVVSAQLAQLYAVNEEGVLQSLVGASADGVHIKAKSIRLEGLITANNNFKVLEDGSIEARNGIFSGKINADSGRIGGFDIDKLLLVWRHHSYTGIQPQAVSIGLSDNATTGVLDIDFSAALPTRFGVKVVGSNMGGACIYTSQYREGQLRPKDDTTYAAFLDGGVSARVYAVHRLEGGVRKDYVGVDASNVDWDHVRCNVRGGLIVDMWREK